MPDLLEIAGSFDIFTPAYSFVRGILEGPSHTFWISHSPMTGREVGRMLNKKGVRCWGLMMIDDSLTVSVRLSQARWAQHLLEQAGVPIENPVAGGQEKRKAAPKASKAQPSAKGWTCKHCGNWYEKRPTTCRGCGGNYFVGWR